MYKTKKLLKEYEVKELAKELMNYFIQHPRFFFTENREATKQFNKELLELFIFEINNLLKQHYPDLDKKYWMLEERIILLEKQIMKLGGEKMKSVKERLTKQEEFNKLNIWIKDNYAWLSIKIEDFVLKKSIKGEEVKDSDIVLLCKEEYDKQKR